MQGHCERCVWGCILVQASGRSWLPRTVLRPRWDLEVPIRSSPVLCRGTAWGCCPSPHCRVGSARWPPCVPGARGRLHVCAAGLQQICAELAAGLRGDGGTLLLLLPWRPRDYPCLGQRDTNGFTALMGAVQHKDTGQPASLRRSRRPERHRSNTYRGVSKRCPGQDSVSL